MGYSVRLVTPEPGRRDPSSDPGVAEGASQEGHGWRGPRRAPGEHAAGDGFATQRRGSFIPHPRRAAKAEAGPVLLRFARLLRSSA